MDVLEHFQKFALAVATIVYHFHRKASEFSEYSSKDIYDALNEVSMTRSSSFILVESDSEASIENTTLRKILIAIFPNQIDFLRRAKRVDTENELSQNTLLESKYRLIYGRITAWRDNGPTSLRSAT